MNARLIALPLLLATTLPALSGAEAAYAQLNPEERLPEPLIAPASDEAERAIQGFTIPPGFKVELVAAEPMLANPVAFHIDEKGRFFVSETHRYRSSVLDIRHYMFMLEDDMALRTVEEREAMTRRHFGPGAEDLAVESEIVRLVEDTTGDGKADRSTIFAGGFNSVLDGIASGVLARQGKVYFTNIPHLWMLEDTTEDGKADRRTSLSHGYGVRFSYTGHDMHGLVFGPDGKLYFSFGDRGAHVVTREGNVLAFPDEGAVFRCNPDGSEMEVIHRGLRNPQELAFDDFGNLFTGDNDSDQGDQERWVYVVEGGDSGWRVGYQHAPRRRGGPWMAENLWQVASANSAAYLLPPIGLINDGPSGLTFNPGTGFPEAYKGHFFLAHFKGVASRSGVHALFSQPKGASFELVDRGPFIWNSLITDVDFGYDGAMYFTDWHHGWPKSGKGRIYRIYDPVARQDPAVAEVKEIFAAGFGHRSEAELAELLTHKDRRVRQEAQFALAEKKALALFTRIARSHDHRLARLHAIWGMGQVGANPANRSEAFAALIPLLLDPDPEVRAQSARVLGDAREDRAAGSLARLLDDPDLRVRYFAAMAVGKLGYRAALPQLLAMLRENADQDLYLRHAGVMALTWIGDRTALLAAARDRAASVRLASLLAMRRLEMPEVALFLHDNEPLLVLEAARAINDEPIAEALPALAALCGAHPQEEALALRAVNAAFRLGRPEDADRLAALARDPSSLPAVRAEALTLLAQWDRPGQRDRLVGNFRPLAARDGRPAADALRPLLPGLLASSSDTVLLAALEASGRLQIQDTVRQITRLISDTDGEAPARVEALKALQQLNPPDLAAIARQATRDPEESVRAQAYATLAVLEPQNVVAPLAAVLEGGRPAERQHALRTLASLDSPQADALLESWLDRLLAREVAPELHLDLLEAAAARGTPALRQKAAQFDAARSKDDPLGNYREALRGGDIIRGRSLFYESPRASCIRCHSVGGEGSSVGPALDGIGARRNRESLLEALVDPNRSIAPGYENVMVTMKSGATHAGILAEETAGELVLNTPGEDLLRLKKADVQSRSPSLSGMPAFTEGVLSKGELRDLVEFLSTLR